MAKVVLTGTLSDLTEGVKELEVDAPNIYQLFQKMAKQYPAIKTLFDDGAVIVSIDGELSQDSLTEKIKPNSEVMIFPQIEGG